MPAFSSVLRRALGESHVTSEFEVENQTCRPKQRHALKEHGGVCREQVAGAGTGREEDRR